MKIYKYLYIIFINVICSLPFAAKAEEKPLWEVAVGAGTINQPYYVGSKETRTVNFPVLYPIYRGDLFKADDKGIRAELLNNSRYKLDISSDFNFAVDSDNIEARQGMDDIGNLLQLGPSLQTTLKKDNSHWLRFNFSGRLASTFTENSFRYSGYTITPQFSYRYSFNILENPWRALIAANVEYGSAEYHDIYYGVDEEFATADRPAYKTTSGYSGYGLTTSLSHRSNRQLLVFFARYKNISDAVYFDSPLVETDESLSVGMLYSYFLFKSKTLIKE